MGDDFRADYHEFRCAKCSGALRLVPHDDPGALTGVCKEHGSMVFIYFPKGTPVRVMRADGSFSETTR